MKILTGALTVAALGGWASAVGWWLAARAWRRAANKAMALAATKHSDYLHAQSNVNALERLLQKEER